MVPSYKGSMVDCLSTDRNSTFRGTAISTCDLYWLAGILEGEGSFIKGPPSKPNSPCISINMCDEDIIIKIAYLFRTAVIKPRIRKINWKQSYSTKVRGYSAVQWMTLLRSLMSSRRKLQIDAAIASFKSTKNGWIKLTIEEIERSRKRIIDGESMRSVARSINVNHALLHRRLKGIVSRNIPIKVI